MILIQGKGVSNGVAIGPLYYYQRAKAADESLTAEANERIGACSRYFPQTAEAFMFDLTAGQSYTVSCGGMRATTTVRTQR